MGTVKVPEGGTGRIITFPAPGRQRKGHPTTGTLKQAMEWLMRVRVLQLAEGMDYDQAREQADKEWRTRK